MRISFQGFDQDVYVEAGVVQVLEVHSKNLFSRFCQSLYSGLGEQAIEPYLIWEGDKRQRTDTAFLFIVNPFELPWSDRKLIGGIYENIEDMLLSDDPTRQEIETTARMLSESLASLGLRMHSDYAFATEWTVLKYLKSFAFSAYIDETDTLLDSLIKFLKYAADANLNRVLVFINLKTFLTYEEIEMFYQEVIFSGLKVLLLETVVDNSKFELERKMVIDEDLFQKQ